MKPCLAAVLLVLLAGCSSATRVVRLDTRQGPVRVHKPRGDQQPVKLSKEKFKAALAEHAPDVRPAAHPLRHARQLMFEERWRHEEYLRWTGRHLEPDAPPGQVRPGPQSLDEFTRDYLSWCGRRRPGATPGDCLRLLTEHALLDADGRYTLAMAIALDSVWDETGEALGQMVDREAVLTTVTAAMALYMMLWVLPEPTSKGLAAVLTAGLMAYLGVDTLWTLIGGWVALVEEVNRAPGFVALREAGRRYGKVMGHNVARLFVMLVTAAIGSTAGLAAKGPGLPAYSEAAMLAEAQGGFQLVAVGEVQAVAVSAEAFTVTLAPGAVTMMAQGMSGAPALVDGEENEHHIATDKWSKDTRHGGPWTPKFQEIFDRAGMSLNDPANKVRVKAHKGPHPREYHEEIYERLDRATSVCRTLQQCRQLLTSELQRLAQELAKEGSRLNKLVTRSE
jgi:hypothetical protein